MLVVTDCGRIAQPGTDGSAYLAALGKELLPIIDICWTGEEIISPTITAADVLRVSQVCCQKHDDSLLTNDDFPIPLNVAGLCTERVPTRRWGAPAGGQLRAARRAVG